MNFRIYTSNIGRGSDQLGPCEVCSKRFDEGYIGYVKSSDGESENYMLDTPATWGHENCVYAAACRRINKVARDWLKRCGEVCVSQ